MLKIKILIYIGLLLPFLCAKGQKPNHIGNLQNDVIYFVLIDRFCDGNTNNNVPLWAFDDSTEYHRFNRYWLPKMYCKNTFEDNRVSLETYWGGDLQGAIDKLEYLSQLGITAIWLSPVFENANGMIYGFGYTAYHGYWTKDWKRLEEHFVNPPTNNQTLDNVLSDAPILEELIEKAHGLGMKVIMDLPLNHTSPAPLKTVLDDIDYYYMELGALYDNGKFVTQVCSPNCKTYCYKCFQNNGWFHLPPYNSVNIYHPVTSHIHDVLPDFDQTNEKVIKYFDETISKWMSFDIDGFRIDAVKHIYPEYLKNIEEEIIGRKNDAVLIGEYYLGGIYENGLSDKVPYSVEWLQNMDYTTIFDFSFANAAREYFIGKKNSIGTPYILETILDSSNPKNHFGEKSDHLVTFINNHDIPRMLSLRGANIDNYMAAMKFMFLSRGVPCLLYGDEIGLSVPYDEKYRQNAHQQIGDVPYCRLMMDWDKLKEQKYLETFNIVKELIAFRKSNDVLRWGNTRFIKASNLNYAIHGLSYIAMERSAYKEGDNGKVYFFYSQEPRKSLRFKVNLVDGVYTDPFTNKPCEVKNGILEWKNIKKDQTLIVSNNI